MAIGLSFPFTRASGSVGYFEVTRNELDAIYANLRSLLLTNWGERVMHYFFGAHLREFQFEPLRGEELKGRIADRIISQVDTWMPYLSIEELNILFSEDDPSVAENAIFIRLRFRLNSRPDLSGVLNQPVTL